MEDMMRRPTKHEYYIGIAEAVSRRSTCLRRHYGCVVVKNDEIIATGYNGNARGQVDCISTGTCSKSDKSHNSDPSSYETCKAVHAEMNALLSAPRAELIGADLYLYCFDVKTGEVDDCFPCPICLRMCQNAGIRSINNAKFKFVNGEGNGSVGDASLQSGAHLPERADSALEEAVDS